MDFLEGLQSHCPKTTRVLFFIGLIIAIRKLIGLLRKVYILTLRRRQNLKKIYGAGSWAFVTGSSEGCYRITKASVVRSLWHWLKKGLT